MACHVFSSSNHAYPQGRRWADLCAMQSRPDGSGSGSGFGWVHPPMSLAVFLDPCDGTNFPFQ